MNAINDMPRGPMNSQHTPDTLTQKYEWWVHATPAAIQVLKAHGAEIYYGHDRAPYIVIAPAKEVIAEWGIAVGYLPGHGSIDATPDRRVMRLVSETPLPHERSRPYAYGPEKYGGSPEAYWAASDQAEAEYQSRAYPAEGILQGRTNARRPIE